MTYRDNFEKWLNDEFFDEETREELSNLTHTSTKQQKRN